MGFSVKTSLFVSLCILRDLPQQKILGSYAVGEILLYFYVPMFPWKDFLMGQITKIQKNKKQRMKERKRRNFYVSGGSHTHVFSISQERPCATHP